MPSIRRCLAPFKFALLCLWHLCPVAMAQSPAPPLPGTQPLPDRADAAERMVAGLDRYLDTAAERLAGKRLQRWIEGTYSGSASEWERFLETRRQELVSALGTGDARGKIQLTFQAPVPTAVEQFDRHPGLLLETSDFRVYTVSWNVFRDVQAEGLLVMPLTEPVADIVAIPDCDWTPEQSLGLDPTRDLDFGFVRHLAEAGCRILIPALIDRGSEFGGNPEVRPMPHSQRETLWRAGFPMGRHPLGYEVQRVLAAADWMKTTQSSISRPEANRGKRPLTVVGFGEGGLIALLSGALDKRFDGVAVSGAFGLFQRHSELPIDRNIWSHLQSLGDAELAALIAPRPLLIVHGKYPQVVHTDRHGGAPGELWRPTWQEIEGEAERLQSIGLEHQTWFVSATPQDVFPKRTLLEFLDFMEVKLNEETSTSTSVSDLSYALTAPLPDAKSRTRRLYMQLLNDTQHLMRTSLPRREKHWESVDRSSPQSFQASAEPQRTLFAEQIIGLLPPPDQDPAPSSKLLFETEKYRGYQVELQVFEEVFASGILLLPKDLQPGEKRPVIVCQHGLEGRPRDLADPTVYHSAYHQYACRLTEEGFITFSPQNPYIGRTVFRQVLRKGQPLGITLWSFIHRQHEVILDWLEKLDFVDPTRIGFYGLSYGGKTAMRIPVLEPRYAAVICSADYNEWIWKTTSSDSPYSYLWTVEYDMPEWNLGNWFNYAELSWLIFPRPFMVERGHDDGVAPDTWVAYEYARTRRHYVKMGLSERTEIEFFDGPHTIHGVGTFNFLRKHLNSPR